MYSWPKSPRLCRKEIEEYIVSMDWTVIGYILLIIPGFLTIWTYRYFTKATKLGDFEYAAWSFVWGMILLFALYYLGKIRGKEFPMIPDYSLEAFMGGVLGTGIGISILISFPVGFIGAILSKLGAFRFLNVLFSKLFDFFSLR